MYKLMIVDDEPMTREYIKARVGELHREWICAGEAADGREALELLEQDEGFDLIMTDIKMPVMTGIELARELAGRRKRPRMVILSGYDEFILAKEAITYGVQEYMLKPLVKEELVAVLHRLARELAEERAAQEAYRALSKQSREQVARNFLHAIITDNHMEIQVLYPLLHRLKINLIEAEGAVLLVDLDEGQLLERDISPSDQALFRYIVHQTAAELAGPESGIMLFVDYKQRTALLVPGEDDGDVRERCGGLFQRLAEAMLSMTGLALWGAAGSAEMDMLQLGASYRTARERLRRRWRAGVPRLFTDDAAAEAPAVELASAAASIRAAMADGREPQLLAALRALAEAAGESLARLDALRLGAGLLEALAGGVPEIRQEAIRSAGQYLRQEAAAERFAPEQAAGLYAGMIGALRAKPDAPDARESEHEIVVKVKEYIYAHYAEPLSLALIADKMGVSAGYLSSLFHQNTPESYIKFLTRVRMEQAAELLKAQPAEKVYDVAEKVGYLSVKHFSYVFKQYFGIPPGEYQEKAAR